MTSPTPRAKKSLGQHFLHDRSAVERIVALLRLAPEDRVLEIGPGPGALTNLLRCQDCLLLLEKDDHWAAFHAGQCREGQRVIAGDALEFPWESLTEPWKITGNLPYNVASPLMWDIVSRCPGLSRAVFMIQKEVADRILAGPNSKTYGALSVWIQSFARPEKGFVLGPGAFAPPPKVDSAVIALTPLAIRPERPDTLSKVIKICFQQRRKQLQGILRSVAGFEPGILTGLGIDPQARPENLSPEDFQRLGRQLFAGGSHGKG